MSRIHKGLFIGLAGLLFAGIAEAGGPGGSLSLTSRMGSTPPSLQGGVKSGFSGLGGSAGGSGGISASTAGGSGSGNIQGSLPGGAGGSLSFGSSLRAPAAPSLPSPPPLPAP